MKLIKVILALTLIVLSFSSLRKRNKKSQSLSGNTPTSTPIASEAAIKVAEEFKKDLKIDGTLEAVYHVQVATNNSATDDAHGSINSASIKANQGDNELGLVFSLDAAPKGNFSKMVVKRGENYVLPFRYTGDWTTQTPTRGKRRLDTTVTVGGTMYNVAIRFDGCIHSPEQQALIILLNKNSSINKSKIRGCKSETINAATTYKANMIGSKNALKDKPAKEAEIKKSEDDIVTIKARMQVIDIEQKKLDGELTEGEKKLAELKEKDETLGQQYESTKLAKAKAEQTITELRNDLKSNNNNESYYQGNASNSKKKYSSASSSLKETCPESESQNNINDAGKGFNERNKSKVSNALKRILP